jgi:hypothetical protein
MNPISNIWKHPKTSVAGVLIAIVTVAGALSRQGITLGTAGSGTVVTLAGVIATALLGLLAQDPVASNSSERESSSSSLSNLSNSSNLSSSSSATSKLGVWALILLLLPLPFAGGCSGATVAQQIVNWTPALQSAVAVVDSTAAMLDPSAAPIFNAATVGFDAASNTLASEAKAYLSNPNATILAQLQTAIVTFQQQVNASLLSAAKIANSASQQKVMADINAVATVVNAMLALVESVSSKAAVARMAAASTIKLATVEPYLNEGKAAEMVAAHYGEPVEVARFQVARAEWSAERAGF